MQVNAGRINQLSVLTKSLRLKTEERAALLGFQNQFRAD